MTSIRWDGAWRGERWLYFGLFLLVWVYLWVRAASVPFVHDEAATFYMYIQSGNFLPPEAALDANNHVLNSALSYVSYRIFGSSWLALRLPNLLAFPLLFWVSLRLAGYLRSPALRLAWMIPLLTTPYFIEFFALCRGYGLSMAWLVCSLSFLPSSSPGFRWKTWFGVLGSMSLAVAANLTLTPLLLLLIVWLLWSGFYQRFSATTWIKAGSMVLVLGVVPVYLAVEHSLHLREAGLLYLGGAEGFVAVTLDSLNRLFFHRTLPVIAVFEIVLFVALAITWVVVVVRNRAWERVWEPAVFFPGFLVALVCSIFLQHLLLDVNYPQDRSALFLFPLMVGSVVWMLDLLPARPKRWTWAWTLLLLFFPVDALVTANASYSRFWRTEAISDRLYEVIQETSVGSEFPPALSGPFIRDLAWNQWNFQEETQASGMLFVDYPSRTADYVYLREYLDPADYTPEYQVVFKDEVSGMSLLKRTDSLTWVPFLDTSFTWIDLSGIEYFNLLETPADSLAGMEFRVTYDLECEALAFPFSLAAVVSEIDTSGTNAFYGAHHLERMADYRKQHLRNARFTLYFQPVSAEADRILTYLWNIGKTPFRVRGRVRMYTIHSNKNGYGTG